ncbi:hypothetical protein FQA39_LY14584 [Lamprigera yunnana]|nr:hypothetical protein FQA39_LY14584 [Lamprigera yunnana]
MAPKLYYIIGSPPVSSVYLTAAALQLELNSIPLNLLEGEHLTEDFLKINPQHTVPTLIDDDGTIIWDSHAINTYLISKYGKDDSLYPKDLVLRAKIDQRLHFDSGLAYPGVRRISEPILFFGKKTIAEDLKAKNVETYGFLETFLKDSKWMVGDNVTVADLCLIPSITSMNVLVPIDPNKFPKLIAYIERAEVNSVMSWIVSNSLTYFQRFCINVLKCGPIPQHVAFIMDGNRRYARKKCIENRIAHNRGFDKLAETLQWCLELGIREVTMYAFSIENFNRSAEEVDTLMNIAREKYKRLMDEKDKLMAEGVKIQVIGNLDLLPADIRKSIADAMLLTKDNDKLYLNIAMAYTSRDDITNAIKMLKKGVSSGSLQLDDIDDQLLNFSLYTNLCKNVDVLVRTSGETRLSDFFLWQGAFANIYITDVLWPEFSIWHLLAIVFKFQCNYKALNNDKYNYEFDKLTPRKREFLDKVDINRINSLKEYKSLCT